MTEMLSVPVDLVPPFMRPFASAMLYGLWGWMSRQLQLVVKAGVPDLLGDEPQSAASLAAAIKAVKGVPVDVDPLFSAKF